MAFVLPGGRNKDGLFNAKSMGAEIFHELYTFSFIAFVCRVCTKDYQSSIKIKGLDLWGGLLVE
jgi:hypothetical protein